MHYILGIRHHGPGSARSVLNALQQLQPDCILVEGPPDANERIAQLSHAEIEPPIALLINTPVQKDERPRAVFYPFAEFSPEWQALQFALKYQIHTEFMDLACQHRFALEKQAEEARRAVETEENADSENEQADESVNDNVDEDLSAAVDENVQDEIEISDEERKFLQYRHDPIALLAHQAGYQDSERFWEHLVEQQPHAGDMFQSINEAMAEIRDYLNSLNPHIEADEEQLLEEYREASMRKIIRQAQKQGFERIVVICGAWHAPALVDLKSTLKDDNQLLKGLPKTKIESAWIAWTHGRLHRQSGYGAGIQAVGWYAHLWKHYQRALEGNIDAEKISIDWLSQFANALREAGHDASSAQIIDATQLIQSLLELRERRIPDLEDLSEAIRSVLHHGYDLPEPIMNQMLLAEKLGHLPEDYSELPIQQDFLKQCKSLRLKLEAVHRGVELDLRQSFDLSKSQFFHRVNLLGLAWAELQNHSSGRGNYKEHWQLSWQPESSLYLNEMSLWGYTIADAAASIVRDKIEQSDDLATVAKYIEQILLAGLDHSLPLALQRLQSLSTLHQDPDVMLATLKPLVTALRYGSVRQFSEHELLQIIEQLSVRLMLSLPQYCQSINDDMAQQTAQQLNGLYLLLQRLDNATLTQYWQELVLTLMQQSYMNGYLHGFVTKLAKQQQLLDLDEIEYYLSQALSVGQTVDYSAGWFEGFISDQALLLLHEDNLWNLVNAWLGDLPEEQFINILPILRRSTSKFSPSESAKIAEKAASGVTVHIAQLPHQFNVERGYATLLSLKNLLHPQAVDAKAKDAKVDLKEGSDVTS
ncbi:DUF5682 family protein [Acinetobacter sp. CFCC 10889]|uniref:DUF5682 family protein n=1 Tax=Acinetobacter sp. CFCC 10889 TaxID=1775557 RepID=UPI000DD08532|nr:DUF5682 family protein [Acinetobacter sp. CFCC 10889]